MTAINLPPLPDEVIEHIRQLQGDAEGHQWRVGDALVGIVDELGPAYGKVVRGARAHVLREIASRIGCDTTTLRDRESMCRFYPRDVRAEYPFSWSQFRALKYAGDRWREYAEWAAANLPAPVAAIRAKIRANGDEVPAWVGRWDRLLALAEAIANDEAADPEVRRLCRGVLGVLTGSVIFV